jgi:RNA polymerase sigma-70 factor (ECF subfamily)
MVAVLQRGSQPTQGQFHEAIANRSDRWFSACLRITHSPELAEDAVQDALLTAWNKRHQFQGDSSLETWIHRIAINAALQLIRKQRPGRFQPLDDEVGESKDSPEHNAVSHDFDTALSAAFRHLSEIERVCFVLRHLEQWKLREIADEMDTNEGRIKQALFRAVKKLRVKLKDMRSQ